jgi:pyruvate,water dikinase
MQHGMKYIKQFREVSLKDVPVVGGKNASLGQMIQDLGPKGVRVPDGFAVTADAYWYFMRHNDLVDTVNELIKKLNVDNLDELGKTGKKIRDLIKAGRIPSDLNDEIADAYGKLSAEYHEKACDVAVRSSATAEDLPEASFAGQQETFLAIAGMNDVLEAYVKCLASLFTDRAIAYRARLNLDFERVALSVGIQKMVRADNATSGVAFSLETESGFKGVVTISASYGLGELLVQGAIIPDEFYVHKDRLKNGFRPIIQKKLGHKSEKLVYDADNHGRTKKVAVAPAEQNQFCLSDDAILEITRATMIIEDHYSALSNRWVPLDIEWAYDGNDKQLYVVQARPETVHSRESASRALVYELDEKNPKVILTGTSIGQKIASGTARVITSLNGGQFNEGDILVTEMTDPDWVPLLKKAAGIITNRGGRTCHAAIVARELGIPAVVAAHNATLLIKTGDQITIDCSKGTEGFIYEGALSFSTQQVELKAPSLKAQVMINCGDPHRAFEYSFLPVDGVGLARLEFIISTMIKVHPMAICKYNDLNAAIQHKIDECARGYENPRDFYVDVLSQGVGMIAGALYPRQVIVRLTDFKSNEYRELIGGAEFEPVEENPMLGFRGAIRYTSPNYQPAFELECKALRRVREVMGFDNISVMIPFVRTVAEAKSSLELLAENGLERGKNGLSIYMMVEIPSNALLINDFCQYFDGFSIGSNDLTQLTLGVDRDSGILASLFDERDKAVKQLMVMAIQGARAHKIPIGICGQAPSDFPELAQELIEAGIDSLSLNPDALRDFFRYFAQEH